MSTQGSIADNNKFAQSARPNGFAITGLVLSIIGLLIGWVPFLSLLAIPLLILGLIFAIVGLVMAMTGRRGRKVMAIVAIVLAVAGLAISFAVTGKTAEALGGHEAVVAPPTSSPAEEPAETPVPVDSSVFKIGQVVPVGDQGLTLTVNRTKSGIASSFEKGEEFLGVEVTFKNGTKKAEDMTGVIFWNLQDAKGTTFSPEMVLNDAYPDLSSNSVAPGRSATGWVFFKQPASLKGAVVQYDDFGDTVTVELG